MGLCVDKIPTIYIIYPLYKSRSIYDMLFIEKRLLSLKEKLEIAKYAYQLEK
jgi:hypothetical protein